MRVSAIVTSLLLAFGVWGGTSVSQELKFSDPPRTGDPLKGAEVYEANCTGCHSLDANRIGPAHRGVVGRAAGMAAGYNYSPALKASGVTWTADQLDKWLTNPQALVKGARMGFRLSDPKARADVIAFLAREGSGQ
jgi:cytochrome c